MDVKRVSGLFIVNSFCIRICMTAVETEINQFCVRFLTATIIPTIANPSETALMTTVTIAFASSNLPDLLFIGASIRNEM